MESIQEKNREVKKQLEFEKQNLDEAKTKLETKLRETKCDLELQKSKYKELGEYRLSWRVTP